MTAQVLNMFPERFNRLFAEMSMWYAALNVNISVVYRTCLQNSEKMTLRPSLTLTYSPIF